MQQVLIDILKYSFPTFSEPNTAEYSGPDVEPDGLISGSPKKDITMPGFV